MVSFKTNQRRAPCTLCMIARPADFRKEEICMAKKINKEKVRLRHAEAKKAFVTLMKFYPLTLDNLDGEIWRDIAGYDGDYQVSTFARIKSFKNGKVRILKPTISGDYIRIELCKDGVQKQFSVHRLVAEAFIPNPEGKPEVNHKDGKKFNCVVENLEWSTRSENIKHAFDTGLEEPNRGENNWQASLTNEQAEYIRENPDGLTGVELAKKLNVTATVISEIQRGLIYKDAGGTIRKSKAKRIPKEERDQIRAEYATGNFTQRELAEKHHCSLTTISTILHELDG